MNIDLSRNTIEKLTFEFVRDNPIVADRPYLAGPGRCGIEHYPLLASISSQLTNKKILDLGTFEGISALALNYGNLKYGNNNTIYTYDITYEKLIPGIFKNTRINFRMEDLFDPVTREMNKEHILSSDLIFIDVDPHEGIVEYDMYLWLKSNNYKGLLIFDDIHLGPGHLGSTSGNSMKMFWDKIEDGDKLDITQVGHISGTGLVSFNFTKSS
jgi:predicted O-methyltransferase YrrM